MKTTVRRLAATEVLVVGGTVHAAALALEAARCGVATTLSMRTTSPILEVGSSMAAALSVSEADALPEELRRAFLTEAEVARDPSGSDWYLLHQTAAIIAVEDLLLDAGVRLFYDSHPIGVLGSGASDERVCGALVGGKFATGAIIASTVVDATSNLDLVRRMGKAHFVSLERPDRYAAWFLTDVDRWTAPAEYSDGTSVTLRGPLAEFRFSPQSGAPDLELRRTIIARHASWCSRHADSAFALERAGDELLLDPATRIDAGGAAGPKSTGLDGLYAIGPAVDLGANDAFLDARTGYASRASELMGRIGGERTPAATTPAHADPRLLVHAFGDAVELGDTVDFGDAVGFGDTVELDGATLHLTEPDYDEPQTAPIEIDIPALPLAVRSDLVIVGGGTSGAQAAQTAGERGLDVVCLEKHSDVGGVSTIGGVPAYWYGRRTPFFKRFHAQLKASVREKRLPVSLGLLDLVLNAGTDVRLRTPTVGAVTRDGRVTHALCITERGLSAAEGRFFVDASGDGDLAAWAGAPYSYGAERDEITYWCSFGSFHRGKDEASRQYMSVVDLRSADDISRGIIAGRRMGGVFRLGRYVQHYLAPRESRHILGDEKVTYHDVMMGRAFPDTVMHCKSNLDIKGMASSRAALTGYIERSFLQNYVSGVPYRALTPKGLENVLVAGKAYSITHDGVSMARMQPDMITLGAVASIAAQQALATGGRAREVNVGSLQEALSDAGILLPGDLPIGPLDERVPAEGEHLVEVIERLNTKPVEASEWARIFARADEARKVLHRRGIVTAEWVLPQLDHLAAALGDPTANDWLLERLDSMIAGDELPDAGELQRRHDMPDHGYAPDAVYLINAIAGTGDVRLVSRLDRVAGLLELDPKVSDHRFSYVHSIAYAAELLADRRAGEIAVEMMERPEIRERFLDREEHDPRESYDYIGERFAYLGLCLARGAARCGLAEGYRRLVDYVGEMRLYLARSARAELRELLGTDHGFERQGWLAEIEKRSGESALKPQAYKEFPA